MSNNTIRGFGADFDGDCVLTFPKTRLHKKALKKRGKCRKHSKSAPKKNQWFPFIFTLPPSLNTVRSKQ